MKRIAGVAFLTITLLSIEPLSAQAPTAKEQEEQQQLSALIKELQVQQNAMDENQTKIDAKLEALSETIREARIFSSRGGR